MTTSTNFNVSPYFDDFDEEKNFHRVLFRPGVPVQARELTQLQTVLQNQVERFGDNIYQTGTVIKGCSFNFDSNVKYVKILDLFADGQDVAVDLVANTFVTDSSGLKADVITVTSGLESQAPDLNTLYLKYLNVGTANGVETKAFSVGSTLTSFKKTYPVESVTVNNGGTGYQNTDAVVFTANGGGTGAAASVLTFANGTVRSIILTQVGSGYENAPTVTITSNTGTGVSLTAINYVGQVVIANNSFANATGNSYLATVSEGIIYQKGFFSRVEPQLAIVGKYNNKPSDVALGFDTIESIVNSSSDTTLLDNSTGSPNFQAPGANRLKLTPVLKVISRTAASTNTQFLSIIEFEQGQVTRNRVETQFNSVNTELSRRTFEESGNYVVRSFPLRTEAISSNTTHLRVVVGSGTGYVEGHRVELYNDTRLTIPKATTERADLSQTVSTAYGNYVFVKEFAGNLDTVTSGRVSLRDTAATHVTSTPGSAPPSPGSEIGKASIRAVVFDSGTPGTPTAVYRVYLYNIVMAAGKNFKSVRAIRSESSGNGIADIILENGDAVLKDARFESLVFPTGTTAIKYANNEQYTYRSQSDTSLGTGGTFSINLLGSGEEWPYTPGGTLNNIQERDFIVVPVSNVVSANAKTGTVTSNNTSNTVTGVGTVFTTDYLVGQFIAIGSLAPNQITSITNNTFLQTRTAPGDAAANVHTLAYPAYIPINGAGQASISIDGTGKILTFNIGHSTTGTANVTVYHDVKVEQAAPKTKTLVPNVYVKLSTSKITSSVNGPWSLGVPDVYRVTGVWVGTSNSYSNTGTDVSSSFVLDDGQRDSFYGLASLTKRPGATVSLSNTNCLLVRLDVYTHSTGRYLSTESYPVDDASGVLPSDKIRSQSITVFQSASTGAAIDLRDAIDFRPIVANTATLSTTVAGATIDPANTFSLGSATKYFPSPDSNFEADIYSYLPRRDIVVIDTYGRPTVVTGTPSNDPKTPTVPRGSMLLGSVNVPPYPSLAAKEAADAGRPDYAVLVTPNQQKGFTMTDIQGIEDRITRLEYYTLLNALEMSTKDLTIPSSTNSSLERFKNGFFVDPFNDYSISNIEDPEFSSMVDPSASVMRPIQDQTNIFLKYDAALSSGVVVKGDYVMPSYTFVNALSQPIATKQRTLVDKYWSFNGRAQAFPAFDNYFDVKSKPVNVSIDTSSALTSLAGAINPFLARSTAVVNQSVSTSSPALIGTRTTSTANFNSTVQTFAQNVTRTTTTTSQQLIGGVPTSTTQQVGDFITDFSIRPYIRAQDIRVFVNGLRPGARHYVFFDKVNVTANTRPAVVANNVSEITETSFTITGAKGAALTATSTGELAFILSIPAETFFVGEREIFVMDFDDLESADSATSTAKAQFVAYNYSASSSSVSLTTKSVTPFVLGTVTNTASTTTRVSFQRESREWIWDGDTGGGGGGEDPIAQSFNIKTQNGADGYFTTGVDLYFAAKDTTLGVTVELREVNAGVPTGRAVPGSRVWRPSSEVNTSNTAASATQFTFQTPVYLKADTEYAIVVYPDGLSPNYRLWVARVGDSDVGNPSLTNNKNWGNGTLFYSTNGTAWTPVQDEDMKFVLRTAVFTASTSNAAFVNEDYEFFTVANQVGAFTGGESLAQLRANYANGSVTSLLTSTTVTGNSTTFTSLSVGDTITLIYGTDPTMADAYFTASGTSVANSFDTATLLSTFANGDFIRFGNSSTGEIRQVVVVSNNTNLTLDAALTAAAANVRVFKVDATFDVATIKSITNNTSMVLDRYGKLSAVATYQKSVTGVVETIDNETSEIIVNKSNAANASFCFLPANSTYLATIVGDSSQATASITSIDNKNINFFSPLISRLEIPGTKTNLVVGVRKESSNSIQEDAYRFGEKAKVNFESNIQSKTNEILNASGSKSLRVIVPLTTTYTTVAPVVDRAPASLLTYKSLINNDATDESGRYGNAVCKHITKRIVLADGLDAEDALVYVTAFKPVGTEILVYVRLMNDADDESFEDKDWTLMLPDTTSVYSSSLDENDRREYRFTIPFAPPSNAIAGFASGNTTSNTVVGSGTTFTTDLANNDLVMLVRTSDQIDYDVRQVTSIANNTQLTVDTPLTSSLSTLVVRKITQPQAAYLNALNSNIVQYHNKQLARFDQFKYAAVKVVLLATDSYLTPVVDDIRLICTTA